MGEEEGYAILCSKPTFREGDEYIPEERSTASYALPSQRFRVQNKRFKTQYSHLYYNRLESLRVPVREAAKRKWGESATFQTLADLAVDEESCIVGTLFKRMDLKPSILKAITQEYSLPMYPPRRKYIASNDNIILEDEKQRITLVGCIPIEELVTGVIAAVKGHQLQDGCFHVEDYCFAGIPPLPAAPPQSCSAEEKYVVFVSGLNVGSAHCDQLALQLLVDTLSGCLGGVEDQAKMRKVVRVIVAGNSITNKPVESSIQLEKKKKKYMSRNYEAHGLEAMRELDTLMAQLASCVHVDIMPGSHDPVNYTLPQQPFHKCTFPKAAQHGTLRGVTNPFMDQVEGRTLLGCSGQNVDDIFRYSEETDSLSILERTLHWRHMIPTAPDTVGCYPFTQEDPFVIESAPHVYFTSNQPSYQQKHVEVEGGGRVLLLAVPNFDVTHSCVLLDLGTMECTEMHFSTGAFTSLPEEVDGARVMEEEVTSQEMEHSNIVEHISDDEMY